MPPDRWVGLALAGAAAVLAGAAAGRGQGAPCLVGLVVLALGIGSVLDSRIALRLTVVLAFTAIPQGLVPSFLVLGPVAFYPYEAPLVIAALHAVARGTRSVHAAASLGCVLALIAMGVLRGHDISAITFDARPAISLVLALAVGAGLASDPDPWPGLRRTVAVVLWISAGFTILASTTSLELIGRSEVASLQYDATTSAVRILTPATWLAVACICGCTVLALVRRGSVKTHVYLLIPSVPIALLGFSRNHLLGLGVAVLALFFLARSGRTVVEKLAGLVLAGSLIAVIVVLVVSTLSADNWLRIQSDAYSDRVLGGLTSEARAEDASAQYRVGENEFLLDGIVEAPLIGHGFGAAFQPPFGPSGQFFRDTAPYYAHNYYLWLAFKGGVLSLLLFVGICLTGLKRARRSGRVLGIVSGALLCAFLAISLVAPAANGIPSSLLFGGVLGVTLAARSFPFPLVADAQAVSDRPSSSVGRARTVPRLLG